VSSLSKQVDSQKGFYLLQFPSLEEETFFVGELFGETDLVEDAVGSFKSYSLAREEKLLSPKFELNREELQDLVEGLPSGVQLRLDSILEGRSEYEKLFQSTKEEFKSSNLKKAVLYTSNFYPGDFISFPDFCEALRTLLRNSQYGYLYGFYNPKNQAAFLGLSPEYIYKCEDSVYSTVAVAGTKLFSDNEPWTDKLKKEHQLVKDGVSKRIDVVWGPNEDLKYGDLVHLKSVGVLSSGMGISKALHPTAAVGTLPHEFFDQIKLGVGKRGHFGGYAELSSVETSFSLVTIRGLEWSSEGMKVCIGGGVLPESDLKTEWAELENKWETFKKLWKA
jgi:isochorismate synthase EntC